MALLYAKASDGYLASIPVNVMGFTQSLNTNGWLKFPSKMLYQWAELSWDNASYEGTKTVAYPITFSTIYATVGILIANPSYINNSDTALNLVSATTSSAIFQVQMMDSDQYSKGIECSFIGI